MHQIVFFIVKTYNLYVFPSTQVYPTFKAKVENSFVSMDLIYNATQLQQVVTSNFLTEISWFPFNSVTEAEIEQYNRDGKVPQNWTARRDLLWLRWAKFAISEWLWEV